MRLHRCRDPVHVGLPEADAEATPDDGDARRLGDEELVEAMRKRALASGILAGLVALGGFAVLHSDSHHLFEHLFEGAALVGPVVSLLSGTAALVLVSARRFELARYAAALAVAAIIAGWALAQYPTVLPGLSVAQAASPQATLIAVVVAVAVGAVLLFPSLGLLFALVLSGRFDDEDTSERRAQARAKLTDIPGAPPLPAVAWSSPPSCGEEPPAPRAPPATYRLPRERL